MSDRHGLRQPGSHGDAKGDSGASYDAPAAPEDPGGGDPGGSHRRTGVVSVLQLRVHHEQRQQQRVPVPQP